MDYIQLLSRVVGDGGDGPWESLDDSRVGAGTPPSDSDSFEFFHASLFQVSGVFLQGDYSGGHKRLQALKDDAATCSKVGTDYTIFAINRCHAVGYLSASQHLMAIRALNKCITQCPRWQEMHAGGLADALIMISSCYEQVGMRDEALHSARLAADVAQNRLEWIDKAGKNHKRRNEGEYLFHASALGPALDEPTALTVAYHRLAQQLAAQGLDGLAGDWFDRAVQAAQRFRLDIASLLVRAGGGTLTAQQGHGHRRPPDVARTVRDRERESNQGNMYWSSNQEASLRLSGLQSSTDISSGSLESPIFSLYAPPESREGVGSVESLEGGFPDGLFLQETMGSDELPSDKQQSQQHRQHHHNQQEQQYQQQQQQQQQQRRKTRARPRSALVSSPAASPFPIPRTAQRERDELRERDRDRELEEGLQRAGAGLRPKSAVSKLGGGYDYQPAQSSAGGGSSRVASHARAVGPPSRALVSALRGGSGLGSDEGPPAGVPAIVDRQHGLLLKGGAKSLSFANPVEMGLLQAPRPLSASAPTLAPLAATTAAAASTLASAAHAQAAAHATTVNATPSLAVLKAQGGMAVALGRGGRARRGKSAAPGVPSMSATGPARLQEGSAQAEGSPGAASSDEAKARERVARHLANESQNRAREKEKEKREAEAARLKAAREAKAAKEAKEARERLEAKAQTQREREQRQREEERVQTLQRDQQRALAHAAALSAHTEALLAQLQTQRAAAEDAIAASERWVVQERKRLQAESQRALEADRAELDRKYRGLREGLVQAQRDAVRSGQFALGASVRVKPDGEGGAEEQEGREGVVVRCRPDSLFDVEYREGEGVEQYVHVRRLSLPVSSAPALDLDLDTAAALAPPALTPIAPLSHLHAHSIRTSNTAEMHAFMAGFSARQQQLAPQLRAKRDLNRGRAATRIQALARGRLARQDKVIRRLLARQAALRQRERELQSRELILAVREEARQAQEALEAQARAHAHAQHAAVVEQSQAPPPQQLDPLPAPAPQPRERMRSNSGAALDSLEAAPPEPGSVNLREHPHPHPHALSDPEPDSPYPHQYDPDGGTFEYPVDYYGSPHQLGDGVVTLMGNVSVLTGSIGNSLDNLDMLYMDYGAEEGEGGLGYDEREDEDDEGEDDGPSEDLGEFSYSYGPATPITQAAEPPAAPRLPELSSTQDPPPLLSLLASGRDSDDGLEDAGPCLTMTLSSNYPFSSRVRPAAVTSSGYSGRRVRKSSLALPAQSAALGAGLSYHPPGQGHLELFSVPLLSPSTCADLTIVLEADCGHQAGLMRWEVHTRGEDVMVLLDSAHWSALSLGPLGQPADHRVSVKCSSLGLDKLLGLFAPGGGEGLEAAERIASGELEGMPGSDKAAIPGGASASSLDNAHAHADAALVAAPDIESPTLGSSTPKSAICAVM